MIFCPKGFTGLDTIAGKTLVGAANKMPNSLTVATREAKLNYSTLQERMPKVERGNYLPEMIFSLG